ncbi:transglutaminase-like domain-containing protein [Luteolibacter sp. LG18]|uniref:transglutaminase-like domain-containing protein n=1 Tax=Luteolibacter sp. LG18 TaxID=2819286 RepID=UPI002B30B9FB|nr:hypothetical protein llg_06590 [Luteolibacter sp. LG18]
MRPNTPPPFLLAAALLFWSAMTDQWLIGVSLAVVVELAQWVRLRWDFRDAAFLRAWHLTVLLVAARMVLTFFEGNRTQIVQQLIVWGPALFFPLQFAQSYGTKETMPLYTFSIVARKRWERNRKLGLGGNPLELPFGHIYLGIILIASTLGKPEEPRSPWFFLVGLLLILGWALLALRNARKMMIIACLALAGGMGVSGMFTLKFLYGWAIRGARGGGGDGFDPNYYKTAIGDLGELKQSSDILWRMKTLQGPTPPLLRTTLYNQYDGGAWVCRVPQPTAVIDTTFNEVRNIEPLPGKVYYLKYRANEATPAAIEAAISDSLPRISLRGAAKLRMPLPVPGHFSSLTGFDLDTVERNDLSTLRVEPKDPVISGTVLWDPKTSPDRPPWDQRPAPGTFVSDLKVPQDEINAVHTTAQQLGLANLPLQQQLTTLKGFFQSEFHYTRYLSIKAPNRSKGEADSAIAKFLTTERRGHCEYFATAATLILRDAGVPTRYAVGYAVMELDPARREAVIRGTHAHAWCRVWDDNAKCWIDFDPTPVNWLANEPSRQGWGQAFDDWLQRLREDFFIWRNDPGNTGLVTLIVATFGTAGAIAIFRGLWRSRRRIEKSSGRAPLQPAFRTPLHDLEPLARKLLGNRPPGMPYSKWLEGLRKHLPENEELGEAIRLHQRVRFDPETAPDEVLSRLATLQRSMRATLKGGRKSVG